MHVFFRYFFTFAWLLGSLNLGMAQGVTPCNQAMNRRSFDQNFDQIKRQQGQLRKLEFAKALTQTACFSSNQVKQIAELFPNDSHKLEFAQLAYPKTFDQVNYYDVYDAFSSFSMAFRLHDWIWAGANPNALSLQSKNKNPRFPKHNYPSSTNYRGNMGCELPLADKDFDLLVGNVVALQGDALRQRAASQMVANQCLTTTQIMQLSSLIQLEINRLSFVKASFSRAYDQDHYESVDQVFTHQSNQKHLREFLLQNSASPAPPPCGVNQKDFAEVKKSIAAEEFNDSRLAVAKQLVANKKCFQSVQIVELVQLMRFENSKLEIAKYAFEYTIDPESFTKVVEVLAFDQSKRELTDFIKSKK